MAYLDPSYRPPQNVGATSPRQTLPVTATDHQQWQDSNHLEDGCDSLSNKGSIKTAFHGV